MNQILPIALCLVLLAGCKKDKPNNDFSGTYKGQFTDGPLNQLVSMNSEIKFDGKKYAANNGSGDFKIEDASIIKFHMANIESMDYVENKVLHGNYNYEIKGDSLILTKIFPPVEHPESSLLIGYKNQYRLKRTK